MPTAQKTAAAKTKLDFDRIRFSTEKELVRVLEEDFALAQYYDIFDNRDELERITNEMLANTVMLNPVIAPKIYRLCSQVQDTLGFHEQINFYVVSSPEINAFSINGYGFVPHIICLYSSLIQNMSDDELRFVIGHEIGHLIYQHNKLDLVQRFLTKDNNERPPAALSINYLRFMHSAEISSDRVGYVAMPDLKVATNTFFKLHCGLSEEHLNFDAAEYLKQLDKMKEYALGDLFTSHPNPMIRIRALMDFAVSELCPGVNKPRFAVAALDKRTNELLELLEVHPKHERDRKKVEFLSAAGIYIASFDEDSYEAKWRLLYDWLSDYTTQPEKYLEFKDIDAVLAKTRRICAYYKKQQDNDKFQLLELVSVLSLYDGRLESEEKLRLLKIGKMLGISTDTVNLILRKSSEEYLTPDKKMSLRKMR